MSKILIAEDDDGIRVVLAEMVEMIGHTAIGSRDGRRALEVLEDNHDVAMVITDVVMPIMDGKELIRRIRAKEAYRELPILIISGAVGPKEIADVLDIGATAFLPKPIKPQDVWEYIKRYLGEA